MDTNTKPMILEVKPTNMYVDEPKPKQRAQITDDKQTQERRIIAGQSMGLLLAITYATDIVVIQ